MAMEFPSSAGSSTKKGFYFSVAGKGGLGTSGSVDEAIAESRDHYRYGGEVNLGIRIGSFLLGGSAEYNWWKQKTKASEVGDTNMSATQMNIAPILGMSFGNFLLVGKPILNSKVTLDQEDASNGKIVYTTPVMPSYVLQLNYKLAGSSYVGVEYSSVTYKNVEVDGEETKLDDEIIYSGWGVIYGFMF
jgi:hypothetical protein